MKADDPGLALLLVLLTGIFGLGGALLGAWVGGNKAKEAALEAWQTQLAEQDKRARQKVLRVFGVALNEIKNVAETYHERKDTEKIVPAVMQSVVRRCEEAQAVAEDLHLLDDDYFAAELVSIVSSARMSAEAAMFNEETAERYVFFVAEHAPKEGTVAKETIAMAIAEGARVRKSTIEQFEILEDGLLAPLRRLVTMDGGDPSVVQDERKAPPTTSPPLASTS